MKPYGVRVEESPDVADIQSRAHKSSVGRVGGSHGYIRSARIKAKIRRYWKRLARRMGKAEANDW